MLKFAKPAHTRSLCDVSARLCDERKITPNTDSSSLSGSDSGLSGSDGALDPGTISGSDSGISDNSDTSTLPPKFRRPKTPFIDRKISMNAGRKTSSNFVRKNNNIRKRHSMYETGGQLNWRQLNKLNNSWNQSEDDLPSIGSPPTHCINESCSRAVPKNYVPIKIVWNGIIV